MVLTTSHHMNKPIAPNMTAKKSEAVEASSTTSSIGPGGTRGCRRKIAFHPTLGYAVAPPMPAKVARRNARERNRVKQVNCGFEVLRAHIPSAAKAKKMSKVDTLRHAVEYIQVLQQMCSDKDSASITNNCPTTTVPATASAASPSYQAPQQYSSGQPQPPLTPNTPTSTNMCFPTPTATGGNESGYDTASSFYSAASPSPMSDLMSPNHHGHQQQTALHHYSPVQHSPNVYHHQHAYEASHHHQEVQSHYNHYGGYGAPEEEDELLDVIAKWQED